MADPVLDEMVRDCTLARTRLISRVLTNLYDEVLAPSGINAPQFVLLVAIHRLEAASRAAIGRFTHLDRSTLTRNMHHLLAGGRIEEIETKAGGRSRPVALTEGGRDLLRRVAPAWRQAQVKSQTVLGAEGAATIMKVGNEIFSSSGE